MNFLIELGLCEIPKTGSHKHIFFLWAVAAAVVFLLSGSLILFLTRTEKLTPDALVQSEKDEESLPKTTVNDRIAYTVDPYVTCRNQLYAHTDNLYSELSLSKIHDAVYGFGGGTVVYDAFSESGELSQRIYIRNPSGKAEARDIHRPLYWVFDYVCDTALKCNNIMIYGRYGLDNEGAFEYYLTDGMDYNRCYFHPGKLLQGDNIEVYECLKEDDILIEDLYIIKVPNTQIVFSEELLNYYQSGQQDEYNLWENIYLLASPDWEKFWNSFQTY